MALAAWQALVDVAHVEPGQKVLIHAGAGGLGSTVIQLAKHLGAHGRHHRPRQRPDMVRDLGADDVIDYTQQDFADVLTGYDLVLDCLGGENLEKSLTVLKPGGLAIGVVGPPDPAFARQTGHPVLRRSWQRSAARSGGRPRSSACATSSSSCAPAAHS